MTKPITSRTRNKRISAITANMHKIVMFLATTPVSQDYLDLLLVQSDAMIRLTAIAKEEHGKTS